MTSAATAKAIGETEQCTIRDKWNGAVVSATTPKSEKSYIRLRTALCYIHGTATPTTFTIKVTRKWCALRLRNKSSSTSQLLRLSRTIILYANNIDDSTMLTKFPHFRREMCTQARTSALPHSGHTSHAIPSVRWYSAIYFSRTSILFALAVKGIVSRRRGGLFSVRKRQSVNSICDLYLRRRSRAQNKNEKKRKNNYRSTDFRFRFRGNTHSLLAKAKLDRKLTHHQPATEMK